MRLMAELEERGLLDRAVEDLPDDAALEARAAAGHGLTRAEIGTLLAFAKIALSDDFVVSNVPDDPYLGRELFRYFPEPMRKRFADGDRGPPTPPRDHRDATCKLPHQPRRTDAARRRARPHRRVGRRVHARLCGGARAFGLRALHAEIDALDAKISGPLQLELFAIVQDVLVDRLGWFTRNSIRTPGLQRIVAHYRDALDELAAILPSLLPRER